jgi:hypothetical protein
MWRFAIGVSMLGGCLGTDVASGPADVRVGWSESSARYDAAPGVDTATLLVGDGVTVPPDRAIVRADIRVKAESYTSASESVDAAARTIVDALSSSEGCTGALVDRQPPRSESDDWIGSFSVRVDADVRGLEDVHERAQRIDHCIGQFHGVAEDARLAGGAIAVGQPAWIVDDPSLHRAALVEQRFAVLRAMEAAPDRPMQFHPEAVTCTSKGTIAPTRASVSGVTLVLDFACTP